MGLRARHQDYRMQKLAEKLGPMLGEGGGPLPSDLVRQADLNAALSALPAPAELPSDVVRQSDLSAALSALAPGEVMVVVKHGTDANTPRPAGAEAVYWDGTVFPNNAVDGDLYFAPPA